MIVKIPIYVEIGKVSDTESISLVAKKLSKEFYQILRKKNFEKYLKELNATIGDITTISDLQILSTDQALESLRTKK